MAAAVNTAAFVWAVVQLLFAEQLGISFGYMCIST